VRIQSTILSGDFEEMKVDEEKEKSEQKVQSADEKDRLLVDLQKELEDERRRADEYFKRVQYLQADFENYKKRIERERLEDERNGIQKLVVELLVLLDELELATKAARQSYDKEQMVRGLEVMLEKFMTLLTKEGLQTIPAVGCPFDPKLHEVVGRVPVEAPEVGKVVEEVRKGFIFDGKVLRPSAVKVGVKEVDTA
jgi:molecular chaperone GrpE